MTSGIDTLEVTKRQRSVGFNEAQAEMITGVLRDSREVDLVNLATKLDLQAAKTELQAEIARIGAALRAEMEILRRDLTIRLGGMIVVATGILLAAKFFG